MLTTSFYSSQLSEWVGENKPHGKQLPICGLDHLKMDPKIVRGIVSPGAKLPMNTYACTQKQHLLTQC